MLDSIITPVTIPALIVVAAFVIDLAAGDPAWMPHPVRGIGRLIALLESLLRRPGRSPGTERLCGMLMALITVFISWGVAYAVLHTAETYSYPLFIILSTYCVYACLAARSLRDEAGRVMEAGDIIEARRRLGRIVGRDTHNLEWPGICKAVVETVSENTSDGIVAPLFFLALGGPPLMLAYKAVNTLDSMVGYRNERYRDFGWFSARLDDAANYIPARLAAIIMAASALILGYNYRGSLRTLLRDGANHPSPNSGRPEAAAAGALGCRLGGSSTYGGIISDKPYIGMALAEPDADAAAGAMRLSSMTAFLAVILTATAQALSTFLL
ncbi:MAG: cobalamin biosynthesis protein CobD [Deltaproteobacteria bacterium]|nr:cobalamin biosynthesis protein CobD [Deltaproteobacteria bacterium]